MIELYHHQKLALAQMRLNDGYALFMEQGTGKTFPVLFRIAELAQAKQIKSALVVAPKAVCSSWTEKIKHLSEEQKAAIKSITFKTECYDSVWRHTDLLDCDWDVVVFDESHYIKNPGAKRTKACLSLALRAKYKYILTGTPTSNGQLCNIWAQFAAITPVEVKGRIYPEAFGGMAYTKWIGEVAYLDKYYKPYKYKDVAAIQEVISAYSMRVKKEECLDLPEKLPDSILSTTIRGCAVTAYKSMVKHSAILEEDVLADNPLVRSLRLRQICSGFIEKEDGSVTEFETTKPKALKDFLTDFEGKLVIFCEFRRSIDKVSEVLNEMKLKHLILDGRTRDKSCWIQFQEDESIRVIICQYQSGAAGIDLFAADTMLFYEPTLRSNSNEQAKDRIHRTGQTKPCSYYYFITEGTIEEAIYNALQNYSDFNEALFTRYIDTYTKGENIGERFNLGV